MTKKIDKIRRQKALLDSINNDTLNAVSYMAHYHIQERTLRRDLDEIANRGEIFEPSLKVLRKKCLGKLHKKVNMDTLSDDLMVKIVISGEPRKIEAHSVEEIREIKLTWVKDDRQES